MGTAKNRCVQLNQYFYMPKGTYIVIPEVSSERRHYVPMGFMTPDILCSNLVKIVPDATLYHFDFQCSYGMDESRLRQVEKQLPLFRSLAV
ncbi:MAG: hypothetical protein LIP11_10785 [Clostridiales bacterium]|nr:hypothetical protein [Clostridiales bacterium]